jgi:hypothetical protein
MRQLRLAVLALLAVCGASRAETVVEYYNASLDHYFMTPLQNEIDALDVSARILGWTRTGFVFEASASAGVGSNPVCRFYIPPVHGDSHFFSASPDECNAVLTKIGNDPNFSGYVEETPAEFYIALPNLATGACAAGTSPVYGLWKGRADSNHRYTADRATRDAMVARGYIPEGYGPDGVAMCTPRAGLGDSQVKLTAGTPYAPNCDGVLPTGVVYPGAEVEAQIAANPGNPSHLIGVWQQDRWSDGGARGLRTAASFDGGLTWSTSQASFTRCSGGNAANGGDYPRASDPWVAIGPDGVAYQIAIAFNGDTLAPGSSSAVLASRSLDGGRTWSHPAALIQDGETAFNDKESITADPVAPGVAYASWDRLERSGHGPSWFSRTTDGGTTWEPSRPIYDPGTRNQTLNNQIVAIRGAGGSVSLANFFTEFDFGQNNVVTHHLAFVRSDDHGATWSGPTRVADILSVGTVDPRNPSSEIRDASNLAAFAAGGNGRVVAVWQDARFSAGARDGIVFSESKDGGATWSAPTQINGVPAVPAFLPSVAIRDDGTVAVTYYDMRGLVALPQPPATDDPRLPVSVVLTTSRDGVTWSERGVAPSFDFNTAPVADGGLFVGDYQGIASTGNAFAAIFVTTNPDLADRTDVYASVFRGVPAATAKTTYRARGGPIPPMTSAWRARIDASIRKTLRQRLNGIAPPLSTLR